MSRGAASGITIAPASAGSGKTGRLTADVASEDAATQLRQAPEASPRKRRAKRAALATTAGRRQSPHRASVVCAFPSGPGVPGAPAIPGPAPPAPPGPAAPLAPGVTVAPVTFGSFPTNATGTE